MPKLPYFTDKKTRSTKTAKHLALANGRIVSISAVQQTFYEDGNVFCFIQSGKQ